MNVVTDVKKNINIFWFRRDLRLQDHPMIEAMLKNELPCLFVYSTHPFERREVGAAQHWWLQKSLTALSQDLKCKKSRLIVSNLEIFDLVSLINQSFEVKKLYFSHVYEPFSLQYDQSVLTRLKKINIDCVSGNATHFFDNRTIHTKTGGFYRVYSPYSRACLPLLFNAYNHLKNSALFDNSYLANISLSDEITKDLDRLFPQTPLFNPSSFLSKSHNNWALGFEHHTPGAQGALKNARDFIAHHLDGYGELRNRPDLPNTSKLSAHLRFGEISPYRLLHELSPLPDTVDKQKWISELLWREFSYHLLLHFPDLHVKNFNEKFNGFSWENRPDFIKAWKYGNTGYDLVDAGMRELRQTGIMHNRIRMIVASFLTKHLLCDWRIGEAWFWDCLLDADPANNPASWQWVAGSGADAAPYFRVFNPLSSAEKFDPKGHYRALYLPKRTPSDLFNRDVSAHLPMIVDHATARHKALELFYALKV